MSVLEPATARTVRTRIQWHLTGSVRRATPRGVHNLTARGAKPLTTRPLFRYACDVDAEPLHRYTKGGYHPTHLGDQLKHGRYRVLHKLGWGGHSTVWAARDEEKGRYVAVKISVSEWQSEQANRQLQVMRTIATSSLQNAGAASVMKVLDHFELDGPNGTHECLVLELLGPSVSDIVDVRFVGDRLPAALAKKVARQTLLGLDYLHQHGIGHGVFTLSLSDSSGEDELSRILGRPELGPVRRVNGEPTEPGSIKIVDYGESFFDTEPPVTLHTPLAVRAPEVVFEDNFDHRVDLWSMGCLLFELFAGQTPFDVLMLTPGILTGQMEDFATDKLPKRWVERANRLKEESIDFVQAGREEEGAVSTHTLQQWLEEIYFDQGKSAELSLEDVRKLAELVSKMLYFEPSSRATASALLKDTWLS
ncbi:serine protein kinase [Emericellopsis atlantica]|uniref:non-specific serine/threonine protein kinase n=1 Tax=Emericellopsis atlantica TaxID=2614577 RepID=A0A9P8CQG2_9HYPO|nr:serine protein kinase [Emericellopsis atlantica]KAG9255598.1 serine protein kinase [Emericellopsis atlantica]